MVIAIIVWVTNVSVIILGKFLSLRLHPFIDAQESHTNVTWYYQVLCGKWERLLCVSATQMFQLPSEIAMSIAATRMYRAPTNFANTHTDMYYFLLFLYSPVLTVVDDSVAPSRTTKKMKTFSQGQNGTRLCRSHSTELR